jgi:hypothetical protein
VYTNTIMRVSYSLFVFTSNKKMFKYILKVNMTNPIQLVVVSTIYYVNYINLFIYM